MKKVFLLAALAAFWLTGCKDDREPEEKAGSITTITAAAPDDDASELKLSLQGADRNQVRWTAGDRIYVAEVSGSSFDAAFGLSAFEATTVAADGKTATFAMVAGQKALTVGRTYMACHVGNFTTAITGGSIAHTIPATLTQAGAGEFANIDRELLFLTTPVTATATGANFTFRHLMALLEFDIWTDDAASFPGFAIDRVTVAASGTPFVTGLQFAASGGGNPVNASTGTLTVNLRDASNSRYALNATKRKLRVPLMWNPTVTAPTGDFTITLHPQTGTPVTFTKPAKVLDAGNIYRMDLKAEAPATKTVTVGAQSGTITAGAAGSATFPVTTAGIANGTAGTVTWYMEAAGTTDVTTLVESFGLSASVSAVSGNSATITATNTAGSYAAAGNYYFRVTIDGVTSDVRTLVITAAKTVSVGAQSGTFVEGSSGTANRADFTVTTTNIANGTYTVTINNLPAGVGLYPSANVTITDNSGSFRFRGNGSQVAGTYTNLTLTIDGVTSAPFTLTIASASGDGTAANPFRVATLADLRKVGTETAAGGWRLDAHYLQTADINFGTASWTPTGTLTGSYDGGGYAIINAYCDGTGYEVGLFSRIGANGVVKNVRLQNAQFISNYSAGSIAGANYGTIQNCQVIGGTVISNSSATSEGAGGIVGINRGGTVQNCFSSNNVSGSVNLGGIAGRNMNDGAPIGRVENCFATGNVTGFGTSATNIGGVVGFSLSGSMLRNCYATGRVGGADDVGGIAGSVQNTATVTGCVALNSIIGGSGGIGRIAGFTFTGANLTNNAAWSGVLVNSSTVTTGTATNQHGADINLTQAKTQSTYSGSPRNWGFAGTEASPWKWGNTAYPLPVLYYQATGDYPSLPTHLQ